VLGKLATEVATDRPRSAGARRRDRAGGVAHRRAGAGDRHPGRADRPELADTAAFCEAYDVALDASANCVVVSGKREGDTRSRRA
jgi:hypothetical protein